MTKLVLKGPMSLNVHEFSQFLVVSKINPPHDIRTKCISKKSTKLLAGLSSGELGEQRTRSNHSLKGIMPVFGTCKPSASI